MEHEFICDSGTAVVMTEAGRVKGYRYDGITVFKGIRYAAARRFHRPEPVEPWKGIWNASGYGFICPIVDKKPRLVQELYLPHRYWVANEDCQNLNVWTPDCDGAKRPVLVWLHGGGFNMGSAMEMAASDGENMCRTGQAVVVSVNHRLNILGYFDLSAFGEEYAGSGNAGTQDLVAALEWIHNNIERFGGDPENVTLFGQSGGGAKVTALLQCPEADGLYARGINMSGVLQDGTPGPYAKSGRKLGEAVMKELGVSGVKELETVPYEALAAAFKKVRPALAAAGEYVGEEPRPDAFFAGDPLAVGFRKESLKVPLMVGTVYGEFSAFWPLIYDRRTAGAEEGRRLVREILGEEKAGKLLPAFEESYPERNPADVLYLDTLFREPARRYIRKRAEAGGRVYSYLLNQDMPIDGGRTPWHCADIPFFFHNTEYVPGVQQKGMTARLEREIFESVMAFARTGRPGHEGIPPWPACTAEKEYTMMFGSPTEVRCNHDGKLLPLARQCLGGVHEELARRADREEE